MVKAFILTLLTAFIAFGQNYGFTMPEFLCRVEINRDQSLSILYEIEFECLEGYHPVDIVDIGFPSGDFQLSSVQAFLDGTPLERIYHSTYISNGVEVHLDQLSIQPGETGVFTFYGVCEDRVFKDTQNDGFASVVFTPTWFEGGMVRDGGNFILEVVFPDGAEPDSVRYHERPFTDAHVDQDGRVVYVWSEYRRANSPYTVGVSFPAALVDGPLRDTPKDPFIGAEDLICIGVFGFFLLIFGLVVFVFISAIRHAARRRERYLPPRIGLEGSGIKRGLTAPMAALLLEQKLDKVLILIVYGLLKKGAVQFDEGLLQKVGSVSGLRSYEKALLESIPNKGPVPAEKVQKIFVDMIAELEEKMKNFSLKETREYYSSVIESAWKMVEADNSAEKAGEILSDRFQWLMADNRFDNRVKSLPQTRTAVLPYYFLGRSSGAALALPVGTVTLQQACSRIAGALESAASGAVRNITALSRTVTSKTNPVPVSTSSRSSGGGCACACACAGCACACAGGGR
jgi:hypothetical protein